MVKKKIDLSEFKVKDKGLLDQTEKATAVEKKLDQVISQQEQQKTKLKPAAGQSRAGRPPMDDSEKKTKPITVKFTQSQFDTITEKAGDVPLAIYLLRRLEQSDLFD